MRFQGVVSARSSLSGKIATRIAKDGMAAGKVWISETVVPLFHRLEEKLDGFSPILNVVGDRTSSPGPAALHKPTLFPELNVPSSADGDWGEVARGIAHLLSSLDGVPELRVAGTEADAKIAVDLNGEIQTIASVKEGVQPKPKWPSGVPGKLLRMILEPDPNTLDAQRHFRLVQLHRCALDGHPEAKAALDKARQILPDETNAAEATFNAILSEDLRSPSGKATAAATLLGDLGFDADRYYVQQSQYIPGLFEDRSLAYYPALKSIRGAFEALRPSPGTWLRFQLPFALPVLSGVYRSEGISILVEHVRVINPRAAWKITQGGRVDSMMSPSGLYAQSVLEVFLPGVLQMEVTRPPGDIPYKNIESYPEGLRVATLRINEFIAGFRMQTGRSDIPEIFPGDFNQLVYKQFDAAGCLVRNASANFEMVRVSFGAPKFNDELCLEVQDVERISFTRELLESAKFFVSAYNARRAVLDLAGAFEAFVAEVVTSQLGGIEESIQSQFLRQYGKKLSTETRAEIAGIKIGSDQDPPRMPTVNSQIKLYKKQGKRPALNQACISRLQKIMRIRNDAAHGRPVPPETLNDLIRAIDALDCLICDCTDAAKSS